MLVASGLLSLVGEGVASVVHAARAGLSVVTVDESHTRYDADLGWTHRPNIRIANYRPGVTFSTDAQGFRAHEEYGAPVPDGKLRIISLGDSFTMGAGVGDDQTFPARLQARCPGVQTVNMGQGGYGLDQAYLWYKRDGIALDANVLLFAIIAQDFYRMGSDTFLGYPKPIIRADAGALRVENVPVPRAAFLKTFRSTSVFINNLAAIRLGREVFHLGSFTGERFYGSVADSVFDAAALALDDLADISRARNQRFVLVYLPGGDVIAKEPTREAGWLEAYARQRGIPFITLVPAFARLPPWDLARMYLPDSHYTPEGQDLVADVLLHGLRDIGVAVPCAP